MRKRLLIGTNNPGKLIEYRELLGELPIELVRPVDLGLTLDVDESGNTYRENARLKALAFAQASGLPSLADDSGIELLAFGGWPGIRSVRFAGPDADDAFRRDAVLDRLAVDRLTSRAASFVCAIAVAEGTAIVAEDQARLDGTIAISARGSGGFGYDPIFVPAGETRSVAELSADEKNRISHRALAVNAIRPTLRRLFADH